MPLLDELISPLISLDDSDEEAPPAGPEQKAPGGAIPITTSRAIGTTNTVARGTAIDVECDAEQRAAPATTRADGRGSAAVHGAAAACRAADGLAKRPERSPESSEKRANAEVDGAADVELAAKRPAVAEAVSAKASDAARRVGPSCQGPGTSASSASAPSSAPSAATPQGDEVDLSFATLDGKPLKFIKRVMGEARRILSKKGLAEAEKGGYQFGLVDRANLSKWSVKIRDLNADGQLAKDLSRYKLDPCIDLEVCLPDGFPIEPPFARVTYPQLTGGYVFQRGGICFELLTTKGWVPTMTLPALAIAVKGILDYGEVRVSGVGDRQHRTVPGYTEDGARKDHAVIVSAHRDGQGSTYGSLKYYKS